MKMKLRPQRLGVGWISEMRMGRTVSSILNWEKNWIWRTLGAQCGILLTSDKTMNRKATRSISIGRLRLILLASTTIWTAGLGHCWRSLENKRPDLAGDRFYGCSLYLSLSSAEQPGKGLTQVHGLESFGLWSLWTICKLFAVTQLGILGTAQIGAVSINGEPIPRMREIDLWWVLTKTQSGTNPKWIPNESDSKRKCCTKRT